MLDKNRELRWLPKEFLLLFAKDEIAGAYSYLPEYLQQDEDIQDCLPCLDCYNKSGITVMDTPHRRGNCKNPAAQKKQTASTAITPAVFQRTTTITPYTNVSCLSMERMLDTIYAYGKHRSLVLLDREAELPFLLAEFLLTYTRGQVAAVYKHLPACVKDYVDIQNCLPPRLRMEAAIAKGLRWFRDNESMIHEPVHNFEYRPELCDDPTSTQESAPRPLYCEGSGHYFAMGAKNCVVFYVYFINEDGDVASRTYFEMCRDGVHFRVTYDPHAVRETGKVVACFTCVDKVCRVKLRTNPFLQMEKCDGKEHIVMTRYPGCAHASCTTYDCMDAKWEESLRAAYARDVCPVYRKSIDPFDM